MFLIGGKGQPIRTLDGVIHLITQHNTTGFSGKTACGIAWRREKGVTFADEGEVVSCMTCLVHEARS